MNEVNVPPAAVPFGMSWHERNPIPRIIQRRGDQYITELVGATHFTEQFRFLPGKSSFLRVNRGSFQYLLCYEYRPLVAIGSEAVVRLQVLDGVVCPHHSFVANTEGGYVHVPTIPRRQALEIARENFEFSPTDNVSCVVERPGWLSPQLKNWTWAVFVTRTTADDVSTGSTYTLWIDAVTGEYLGCKERAWLLGGVIKRRFD